METRFQSINDSDRIWIYQAERMLSTDEVTIIQKSGNEFVASWAAHGKQLRAEVIVLHNLFVIVSLDERQALATGCSIDKSLGWISALGAQLHINFIDRLQVAWLDEQKNIQLGSLNEFEALAERAEIESDTLVFNNLVFNGEELKNNWLIPAKESWHNRYFPVSHEK
jgi:hypothetical protein